MNDTLANVLSKVLNAERVGKKTIEITPVSKVVRKVLGILNEKNYIGSFEETETSRGIVATVHLLHTINNVGVIKPRFAFRVSDYEKVEKLYLPAKDFGVIIVTTPKGLMTLDEAKENRIGGRLIAYCY